MNEYTFNEKNLRVGQFYLRSFHSRPILLPKFFLELRNAPKVLKLSNFALFDQILTVSVNFLIVNISF